MATPTSAGYVFAISPSPDGNVNAVLDDYRWGSPLTLTYSFRSAGSYWSTAGNDYGASNSSGEPWGSGWYLMSAAQQSAVVSALNAWAEVANLGFTLVTDSQTVAGDLRFGFTTNTSPGSGAPAWAWFPYANAKGGDVWFNNDYYDNIGTAQVGSYGYYTMLHEIGHALGLKHPFEGAPVLPSGTDWIGYTLMSYSDYAGDPHDGLGSALTPSTPMLYDIAAMQYLYGANYSTRAGDTSYSWGVGESIYETIWDGGGNDTIDWSNQSSAATINLTSGVWSYLGPLRWDEASNTNQNLNIAFNCVIENANGGSASDSITGNSAGNSLFGNAGDDTLGGGTGNDSLEGGNGNDRLYGGDGNDRFDWQADTRAGADIMTGGAGNDTYVLDALSDQIVEAPGGGTDLVWTTFSYSLALAPNVENLSLFGSGRADAIGSSAKNTMRGNDGANELRGLGGDDFIDGGKGNDTLNGGGGADRFVFSKACNASTNRDLIQDFTQGVDTITLDDDIFKAFGQGGTRDLAASAFYAGTAAHDADDRVIYNRASGILYYDADGKGGIGALQVAVLGASSHPLLKFSDLQIVG